MIDAAGGCAKVALRVKFSASRFGDLYQTAFKNGRLQMPSKEQIKEVVDLCLSSEQEREAKVTDLGQLLDRYREALKIEKKRDLAPANTLSVRGILRWTENEDGELVSRCFGCGAMTSGPPMTFRERLCQRPECESIRRSFAGLEDKVITVLADWKGKIEPKRLPSPDLVERLDLFAWAAKGILQECEQAAREGAEDAINYASRFVPYPVDHLREFGLTCGSPHLYRSMRVEKPYELPCPSYVLDMSWYDWTNTLKDPRSWAIMNLAINHGKKFLAVWTAGNAGLSLAKLAQRANMFLEKDARVSVYAFHDEKDDIQDAIRALKIWGAKVSSADPSDQIWSPQWMMDMVAGSEGSVFEEEAYWEVSDGWDAISLLQYRLLFCQVFAHLQPTHVVVPAGTGNLLMGAALAAQDCSDLVNLLVFAAVPEGSDNLHSLSMRLRPTTRSRFCMPKVVSTYSPLLPCIKIATEREQIKWLIIQDTDSHTRAAERLLYAPFDEAPIASEPSSMVGFAALPLLKPQLNAKHRLLIVNTGCGLLREDEQAFLDTPREFYKHRRT